MSTEGPESETESEESADTVSPDETDNTSLMNTTRRTLLATGTGVLGLLSLSGQGSAAGDGTVATNESLRRMQTQLELGGSYATTAGQGIELTEESPTGFTYGVRGIAESPKGRGVFGDATSKTGNNYGLWGRTASKDGVGLQGTATNGTGSTVGIRGVSKSPNGVALQGSNNAGSGQAIGLRGATNSPDGFGIKTPDKAEVGDNLRVKGDVVCDGQKNFVQSVETAAGTRNVYYTAVEAGKPHTEVNDTAEMTDGEAVVDLPEHFDLVTSDDDTLTVQVTPYAKAEVKPQVVEVTTERIEVVDFGDGPDDYTFAYTVKGTRDGFEDPDIVRDR